MSKAESDKLSTKSYAAKVLHKSLVTGVSNIIESSSIICKIFKTTVLLLCMVGFVYQVYYFVKDVLTFPSVVNVRVETLKEFVAPAYTFCNTNGIKRSKYCEKYPEFCEKPENMTDFCLQYSYYCRVNTENFTMPIEDAYYTEVNGTEDVFKELGQDLESFLANLRDHMREDIEGPFERYMEHADKILQCYSKNSLVDSNKLPKLTSKTLGGIPIDSFEFDLEEHETFNRNGMPGALFALHSPFVAVDPDLDGILLKPGRSYKIHLSIEEQVSLPWPYKTDCVNYTLIWENENRTGPRSKTACEEECILTHFLTCMNCSMPWWLYPHNATICDTDNLENYSCPDMSERYDKYYDCLDECKVDCSKVKYQYEVKERYIASSAFKGSRRKNHRFTYVDIFLTEREIVTLEHRPQYKDVEVYSYIGGFMGCWLGVSLVAVIDFIESIVHILFYHMKKRYYS
ncbi:uncharacterized protein LOC129231073 [Uloborus diversus]|uniref:uncharacterized protein LOC129231073 n=1 Tax=Uloborus diversus TaxID=327109 RepID=UPI002409D9FF|nr:uncharacterized protein LOC129231073 [Uloborus diversus]